jgi:hypothetical protein
MLGRALALAIIGSKLYEPLGPPIETKVKGLNFSLLNVCKKRGKL